MKEERAEASGVVWVSRFAIAGEPRLASEECPVSLVTAESHAFIEEFAALRALGPGSLAVPLSARRADALLTLQVEWERLEYMKNG